MLMEILGFLFLERDDQLFGGHKLTWCTDTDDGIMQ